MDTDSASVPEAKGDSDDVLPEAMGDSDDILPEAEGDGDDVLPDDLMEEGDDSAEEEEEEDAGDDDDGWITPSNIQEVKRRMGVGAADTEEKGVSVACLTTDFAMQVKPPSFESKLFLFFSLFSFCVPLEEGVAYVTIFNPSTSTMASTWEPCAGKGSVL